MKKSIVVRMAVVMVVIMGAVAASCHIDKESAQEREQQEVLELVNQECTDRLSVREGDAAVVACESAMDEAIAVYGPGYAPVWHKGDDFWTFAPAGK